MMQTNHLRAACVTAITLLLASVTSAAPPKTDTLRRQHEQTFQQIWTRVKERHYDPTLNGVNWEAVRKRYAPLVARAKNDREFYTLLNQMLGELKQSHFGVLPPEEYLAQEEGAGRSMEGQTGMIVQLVEDRAIVTRVEPGSSAERAGLRPGFVVTGIGGRSVSDDLVRRVRARKLGVAQERVQVYFGMLALLNGPVDSTVRVAWLDGDDRPQSAEIARVQAEGERVQLGALPPVSVRLETKRLADGIGYARFNLFMMPLLEPLKKAIEEMRASGAPGIILDLRGNVGGVGFMATPIASSFAAKRGTLGTMKLRQGEMRFVVFPTANAYAGPLVLLTDEASLSTSEVLAGGLQESRRAAIIGRPTAGMILPSLVERLPGGARFQYAIADFKTPGGVLLEGRGVLPDVSVALTRRDLLAGRDPILDRAVAFIQTQKTTDTKGKSNE